MRCWRRSPIERGSKHGNLSSNGAHSTARAPHRARSQRLLFCGHVYRAERGVRIAARLRRSREDSRLHMTTALTNEASAVVHYSYKDLLICVGHQCELTVNGLCWRVVDMGEF